MKKITKWKPDTCECEIFYEWDDQDSEDNRQHVVTETVPCAAHQPEVISTRKLGGRALAGKERHEAVFNDVLGENQKKNRVLAELLEDDDIGEAATTSDGAPHRRFKNGVEPTWSFDPATRALKIQLRQSVIPAKRVALAAKIRKNHADVTIE